MPYIKKDFIDRLDERQKKDGDLLLQTVREHTEGLRHEGTSYKFVCPCCGAHALTVTPGKMMFKCFSCNEVSGKTAKDFLMSPAVKKDLPAAVEYIAAAYGMAVEYEERKKPGRKPKASGDDVSFCAQMLKESGLTKEDVTARVKLDSGDSGFRTVETFSRGSLDDRYNIDKDGNDAIIRYFDLEGNPCKYTSSKGAVSVEREYFRVRFQFPEAHKDKNGRAMKYRSPVGAPTFIYYPERIRDIWRRREELPTLYIQEGEKKAEKASKHGILSVAISGIQNLGYHGRLPEDLVKLIRDCKVKNVVFLMDSDLHDITKTLREDDPVERRPKNFFYAVKNFKEYMLSLRNQNIELEIYYGHVKKNEAEDKGIDDLLTNTLKGREDELKKDIETALLEKSGTGTYVQLFKITTANDGKILAQFDLQAPRAFCEKHYDELKHLRKFQAFGRDWTFTEGGQLESAQPVEPEETFWKEELRGERKVLRYNYTAALKFLENRGFFRIEKPGGEEYDFVRVDKGVVRTVPIHKIIDYIFDFTKDCLPLEVNEMLLSGGSQYLGAWQVGRLPYFQPMFNKPQRGQEFFYFQNETWRITADGIEVTPYTDIHFNIWADQIHDDQAVTRLPELIQIYKAPDTGAYSYVLTPTGRQCDFLQFLINASNFTWRKKEVSPQEQEDNAQHLVSKLCAFGYLVTTFKDMSISKAVVAMDGKPQEFDEANGRTGKSLFGQALRKVVKTKQLNGKEIGTSGANRQFIWEGIDEKTRLVVGDDLLRDFDFDMMFSLTTADWPVNPKNKSSYTIPFSQSPKIFLNSNYAIAGDGSSYTDRLWLLAFSDFYNDEHKPIDDFGVLFFEEWSPEQWNLFWNLAAQCVQIYYKFGYVPTPDDRLEERRLTQQIGTDFLTWADEYFNEEGEHINQRILREDMFHDFLETAQKTRGLKFTCSSKTFSMKLNNYIRLRGLFLNPGKYNPVTKLWNDYDADGRPKKRDSSNGKEYFTVGNAEFYKLNPMMPPAPATLELDLMPDSDPSDDDMPV